MECSPHVVNLWNRWFAQEGWRSETEQECWALIHHAEEVWRAAETIQSYTRLAFNSAIADKSSSLVGPGYGLMLGYGHDLAVREVLRLASWQGGQCECGQPLHVDQVAAHITAVHGLVQRAEYPAWLA